jgi:SAM-dependent methyltransferase
MRSCTLCNNPKIQSLTPEGDSRTYCFCNCCKLIFTDAQYHLSKKTSAEHYVYHENGPHNKGYVQFLERVIKPSLPFLDVDMIGLDYGCGPSPTLSILLNNHGLKCYNYDPVFEILHPYSQYDFIFCTECYEHFFCPADDISHITRLLKRRGILGIMTEQWEDLEQFSHWYYKMDPTHVSFYHYKTMLHICEAFGFKIIYKDNKRVVIMQKI